MASARGDPVIISGLVAIAPAAAADGCDTPAGSLAGNADDSREVASG
ncbi:MAG: hypothetical protein ABIS92_16515 [Polyangia bacterium]